jgi:hypothetical protein
MMTTMSIGWDYVSTAVTNGSIVYPSGNIWAWRAMVERCRQRKTRDSSIRTLWQSYQQSSVTKQDEELNEVMNLELWSIFFHTCKLFLYMPQNLTTWGLRLTFPPNEGVLRIFIAFKIHRLGRLLKPRTYGSVRKHANRYTTEATKLQ